MASECETGGDATENSTHGLFDFQVIVPRFSFYEVKADQGNCLQDMYLRGRLRSQFLLADRGVVENG